MSSMNVTLEPSEGSTIRNPGREQIRSMLERIGRGLDHCVLDLGVEAGFLQAAGKADRLLIQYRDASGMFESVRSDLDAAAVERVFVDAMGGATGWKTELVFRPTVEAEGGDSSRRGGSTAPRKTPEQDLVDAAKRAAKAGLARLAKGGFRGLFGGKS